MAIFKWTWWLTVRVVVVSWKLIKNYLPIVLLLMSLALNMALFTGGTIYKVASTALESVTGLRSVASQHASALAELGNDLDLERKANRKLRGEVADISGNLVNEKKLSRKMGLELVDKSQDLLTARQLTKELRGKIDGANRRIVTYGGKKMALSEAVEITSDKVSKRVAKISASSFSSMGGQALPVIGTAVIVAATTYEIKNLCETIKDMNALKFAFNPDLQPGPEETTVCSLLVPSKEELWASAKASPGAAWESAKKFTPSIEDVQNYEFPDVDWTGMWVTTTGTAVMLKDGAAEGSARAWEATKDGTGYAWGATKDGAGYAWDGTKSGTGYAWEATKEGTANLWGFIKENTPDLEDDDGNPDEGTTAAPELTTQPASP